ncbi:MAG: histidine phosphatase family protein [Saprospiraceae bacterium]|nr:histidine phosphatase family protein [Saprospiraceae bacterium]
MKKLLFYYLAFIAMPSVYSQNTIAYTKPLPKFDNKGTIRMPDGTTLKIDNFADTEGAIFFIVRHAEKDTTGGSNADLNATGRGRALALRKMLKKVKLNGIYSTDRPRTKHTAEPVAKQQHHIVELYDAKKQQELLAKLVAQKGKFLVVGHSNTVPQLVNILRGNDEEKEFSESDYSRFYIVSVKKLGEAQVLMIRF